MSSETYERVASRHGMNGNGIGPENGILEGNSPRDTATKRTISSFPSSSGAKASIEAPSTSTYSSTGEKGTASGGMGPGPSWRVPSLRAILFMVAGIVVLFLVVAMIQFGSVPEGSRSKYAFNMQDGTLMPGGRWGIGGVVGDNQQTQPPPASPATDDDEESRQSGTKKYDTSSSTGAVTKSAETSKSQLVKLPSKRAQSGKILVTGAATFLGFHAIQQMTSEQRKHLVAIDDFDSSMDDSLEMKRYRALLLYQDHAIQIQQVDICKENQLRDLLDKSVTHVLHLHDPIDPPVGEVSRLKKELEHRRKCHETLFDGIKQHKKEMQHTIPVIYLSSSMVSSGKLTESTSSSQFANDTMFAVNKAAQEGLARVHFEYENTPSLGVRLHSVYGPLASSSSPLVRAAFSLVYGRTGTRVHFPSTDFINVKSAADFIVNALKLFENVDFPKIFPSLVVDIGSGTSVDVGSTVEKLKLAIDEKDSTSLTGTTVFDTHTKADLSPLRKAFQKSVDVESLDDGLTSFGKWFKSFYFPKGYVFSTYLVSLKDPQRRKAYSTDGKYDLIRSFYESVHKVDIQAYIFHDGLSISFRNQYQTPRFRFVDVSELYERLEGTEVNRYVSNNDRRFFYFYRFMERIEASRPQKNLPTYTMSTDLFDVRFLKNPFDFMDEHDPKALFVGSEPFQFRNNWWMNNRMKECKFTAEQKKQFAEPENKYLLNAGIVGGRWDVMKDFLDRLIKTFPKFNPNTNCNMPLVNLVGYEQFSDRLVTGHPFHSIYKQYWKKREDVYIIHK